MKRTNPDYSTTVVEEKSLETLDYGTQTQPVLKLKRSSQTVDASKRLAFELSQYSTQQEILQTLVDLEKELPVESLEVAEFVIRTLWERFYETLDTAVRVKVVSLLASVGSFPGLNVHAVIEDLINLLNTNDESRSIGKLIHLLFNCMFSDKNYDWNLKGAWRTDQPSPEPPTPLQSNKRKGKICTQPCTLIVNTFYNSNSIHMLFIFGRGLVRQWCLYNVWGCT